MSEENQYQPNQVPQSNPQQPFNPQQFDPQFNSNYQPGYQPQPYQPQPQQQMPNNFSAQQSGNIQQAPNNNYVEPPKKNGSKWVIGCLIAFVVFSLLGLCSCVAIVRAAKSIDTENTTTQGNSINENKLEKESNQSVESGVADEKVNGATAREVLKETMDLNKKENVYDANYYSRESLINVLIEMGYSKEASIDAVDSLHMDWVKEAEGEIKEEQHVLGERASKEFLIDYLTNVSKFTKEEAQQAIQNLNIK